MIDILDKHINAQVEAYKANRYKNSNSQGMSYIRRLFKPPTVSVNATKVQFKVEKLKKEWHI